MSATKAYFQRFKSFHHLLSMTNFLKLPTDYYEFFAFLYTSVILNSCVCEIKSKLRISHTHVRLISERLRVQIISYTPNMATNFFNMLSIKALFYICVICVNLHLYRGPWKILLHVQTFYLLVSINVSFRSLLQ
jgi:hypothetical protein